MKRTQNISGIVTSKMNAKRFAAILDNQFSDTPNSEAIEVHVQDRRKYQTIEGFGGAFTEAAAITFFKMPGPVQQAIVDAYFHPKIGHGYTFGRTHINSCDFSLNNYSYVESPDDTELTTFNIGRDRQNLIPFIRTALSTAQTQLKLLASPWSPPPWMKTNGQMNLGGKLKWKYASVWAKYFCKYIREYQSEGILIWGITVQNEPEAKQQWDSCLYTGEEERDFIRDFLGPALYANDLSHIKIIIWDHNRDRMIDRAKIIYEDREASKFVWGTGFHWYGEDCFENVQKHYESYPDKKLIFTEGCQEGGPHLGSWDLGERYAKSIINDLNGGTVAWIDWNLILDKNGGPNHVGNFCSAPIIADTSTGNCFYQSSYYYIGHFSRYILPGSIRIFTSTSTQSIQALGAIRPDGTIVIIILNSSDSQYPINLFSGQFVKSLISPSHSIMTLIYNPE